MTYELVNLTAFDLISVCVRLFESMFVLLTLCVGCQSIQLRDRQLSTAEPEEPMLYYLGLLLCLVSVLAVFALFIFCVVLGSMITQLADDVRPSDYLWLTKEDEKVLFGACFLL